MTPVRESSCQFLPELASKSARGLKTALFSSWTTTSRSIGVPLGSVNDANHSDADIELAPSVLATSVPPATSTKQGTAVAPSGTDEQAASALRTSSRRSVWTDQRLPK